jgi:hypothetical protein
LSDPAPRLQYHPRASERDLRDSILTKGFFLVLFMVMGSGMLWIMYDRSKNFVCSDEI